MKSGGVEQFGVKGRFARFRARPTLYRNTLFTQHLQVGVYDQGRYCVKRENGVHHFHQLLHEFYTKPGK